MKTRKTKGFTIVELIIVIAVIGILAAILIPTFASIIRKSSIATDVSLCKNLNTANAVSLEESSLGDIPQTLDQVLSNISVNGMALDKLTPKTEGTAFYWVKELNKIIFVDKSEAADVSSDQYTDEWTVLWPQEIAELTGNDKTQVFTTDVSVNGHGINYFNINRRIVADLTWVQNNQEKIEHARGGTPQTLEVNTAEQLMSISKVVEGDVVLPPNPNVKGATKSSTLSQYNFENITIKLGGDVFIGGNVWSPIGAPIRGGTVNIDGIDVVFTYNGNKEYRFAGTFDGQGHKITGLTLNKDYDPDILYINRFGATAMTFGLFGSTFDATIKNVDLVNVCIDNRGMKSSDGTADINGDSIAALVGLSAGELTVENCTVSGEVYSWDCAAGIVARHYASSKLTVKNCENNAKVVAFGVDGTGGGKKAGGILGYAGNHFDTILFENVVNNGEVIGGTAGGIASYMSANQSLDRGTIILRNCTNNGRISNTFDGVSFVAGGAGGIFGSSFRANSKTEVSILENLVNNGTIVSTNGNASFGIMGGLLSPVTIRGKIENKGSVTCAEGRLNTMGAYGLFGSVQSSVTVEAGAELKQTGAVTASGLGGAYGAFGLVTGSLTINGSILQSGDVSAADYYAQGLIGNVQYNELTFGAGSNVTMSGDVRGAVYASGGIGHIYSAADRTLGTVNVNAGATINISGSIYAVGGTTAGTDEADTAIAAGFIRSSLGGFKKITATTPDSCEMFNAQVIINGTVNITSPVINATTNSAFRTGTNGTYHTAAAGFMGRVQYCTSIVLGDTANVNVEGCNISAKAENSGYKSFVIAGGLTGYVSGSTTGNLGDGTSAYLEVTMSGEANVENCTITAEGPVAANNSTNDGIGRKGTAAYLNVSGLSVNGVAQ